MISFPDKKYNIIYADPPWQFQAGGGRKPPYPVMKYRDICSLPVDGITAENCILFLWATDPQLPDAINLIEDWGFKYKTVAFTWVKSGKNTDFTIGLGYWTRGNPEMCLLATKGRVERVSKSVRQLIINPRRGHSVKPSIIREKIVELVGDLPRIELFARPPKDLLFEDKSFEGWDVWGNEC